MRDVRPQVIVGYNDFGGYGHPDHIRAALIAKAAFERAEGLPDPPLKLYESARDWTRMDEFRKRAAERGADAWWNPDEEESEQDRTQRMEQFAKMQAATGPITTVVGVSATSRPSARRWRSMSPSSRPRCLSWRSGRRLARADARRGLHAPCFTRLACASRRTISSPVDDSAAQATGR